MKTLQILAISGSLRAQSSNKAALQAVQRLAPDDMGIRLYEGLGELPAFNPDLDVEPAPDAVTKLRLRVRESQGLLISTPEYAHGVPGALKNALDWLVSGTEILDKPIALINTSPRATWAQASLQEILTVMSARLIPEAFVTLPLFGRNLSADEIASEKAYSVPLRHSLDLFRSVLGKA